MTDTSHHDPNDSREVRTKEQMVERRAERMAQQVRDDIREVMSTPEGRRFLHSTLWQLCEVQNHQYRPGGLPEQRDQDYLLGRQSIGLQLLEQLEAHAPDESLEMRAEAKALAAALKAEIAAEDALFSDDDSQTEDTDG